VYAANLKTIQQSNARNGGFTLEVNQFADLTWDEFRADWLGASGQETCSATGNHVRNGLTPPAAIDWRDKVCDHPCICVRSGQADRALW
jgi:cathepsin H